MPIQVSCAACGRKLNAPDAAAGTRGKCPHCGELLRIPSRSSGPTGEHTGEPPRHLGRGADAKQSGTAGLCYHGSRWAQLLGGRVTDIVFPPTFTLRNDCIETKRVGVFFLPWTSEVERMPFGKVASYRHLKGLIWDMIVVETSGGSNDLRIRGLPKRDAERLTAALDDRLAVPSHAHM